MDFLRQKALFGKHSAHFAPSGRKLENPGGNIVNRRESADDKACVDEPDAPRVRARRETWQPREGHNPHAGKDRPVKKERCKSDEQKRCRHLARIDYRNANAPLLEQIRPSDKEQQIAAKDQDDDPERQAPDGEQAHDA